MVHAPVFRVEIAPVITELQGLLIHGQMTARC
jgi:hypothetical protein